MRGALRIRAQCPAIDPRPSYQRIFSSTVLERYLKSYRAKEPLQKGHNLVLLRTVLPDTQDRLLNKQGQLTGLVDNPTVSRDIKYFCAGDPHSPPADLARSGTTTDTRRRGRKNPFEFASLPKASDADPVVPPSAGQSGSTGAQNTQQGFVKIPPQRHGSQMRGANRPSTRPTSMLTPSTRLGVASLFAAPPQGANPANRKPPSAASNTAGIRSPRLHDRSRTPPNDDLLLNAKANPASPTASNPVNFSSPAWSGPAPGSGRFSRKTELQKRPVSFAGWGYEAVQSPVSTPKKAMASPSSAAAPFFGGSNSANRASYTGHGAASSGRGNPANNLARDTHSWRDDEDEDEDELDCEPDVLFLVKSPPRPSS